MHKLFFTLNFLVLLCVLSLSGCGILKKKAEPSPVDFKRAVSKPLPPEKTEELLGEVGANWFYGQGLGETALTAGTIFVFPPYAIYVVGNGILNLTGYEEIRFSDALPEEDRRVWNDTFDSVTSVPGRFTAAVAGKEFRTKDVAKEKLNAIIKEEDQNAPGRDSNQTAH